MSAEIMNPGTEKQILKVVLPDSSILYQDLTTKQAWKEQKENGQMVRSNVLTEEELSLLNAFQLDTGWIPAGSPVQIRIFFSVSAGKIVVDMPGDIQLSYDDADVRVGQDLSTWLSWVGEQGGGNFHMEGGIEFGAMYRIYVPMPYPIPDIDVEDFFPYVPHLDLGIFQDCGFTPFLLGNTLHCADQLYPQWLGLPAINLGVARLEIGAEFSGEAEAVLSGQSICADNSACVYDEGASQSYSVFIPDCQTNVPVTSEYNSDCHLEWKLNISPGGCLVIFLLPDICLTPVAIPITIFSQDLALDFNEPTVSFDIEADVPFALDITPGTCPNPLRLNPNSDGILQAALLGTAELDVYDIDVSTIELEGVPVYMSSYRDAATPMPEGAEVCECNTDEPDGFTDLIVKFERPKIAEALGEVHEGDEVELTITGQLLDGTCFEETDCMLIFETGPPVAALNASDESSQPNSFSISNYPNPFNPTTAISLSLPHACYVNLEIFNIKGQRIETLVDGEMTAGSHTVTWDGSRVASGIYLYRLQAGDFVESKKMMLIK
ncbi:MAG: T9SS type A sorting domain-containing protein [Candidatus Zixiibacteriota bacterium]|nr:MAG: T9SS type A sorting domain-containing protein [candidate division Zixibacteria bacterium]